MYGYVSSGVPETVHMRRFESSAGALEGGGQMKNRNSADFAGCLVTVLLLLWLVAMWTLCKVLIG